MNKKKQYIVLLSLLGGFLFSCSLSSCDDFLDKSPDERTELNTKAKIRDVLLSAYPSGNYSLMAELSSDNFIDNNNYLNPSPKLNAFHRFHDELFRWEAVVSANNQDTPNSVWATTYHAIAVANHALEAIEKLESEEYNQDLSPQKGEALICRAYGHFVLVNLFCQAYKDEAASRLDAGIPYITKPETTAFVHYERGSVTEAYQNIEADIEAGFHLISDQEYTVPQYHFNRKAAAAFAARFYLYKRNYPKVIEYATIALGEDISKNSLRVWNKDYANMRALGYDYVDAIHPSNLLLLPTYSRFDWVFGSRYGHNGPAMLGAIYGIGPTWNANTGHQLPPSFEGKLYMAGSQDYGILFPKYYEMFEYTDKVAGIGYARNVRVEFSLEETLLCRAEAHVYLNNITEAVKDLQYWNESRLSPLELTETVINSFYTSSNTLFVKTFNTEKMSTEFIVSSRQKPLIDCILHFRRIETIFDGFRWFDIKRYGIEIEHAVGPENLVLRLTYNDPRRALQLPASVIAAGLEPNLYDRSASDKFIKIEVK